MDNHQLIDKIALLTQKISQKNRILREAQEVAKEKYELEIELKQLMRQYLQEDLKESVQEEKRTPQIVLAKFNGNNKDFRKTLQQETRKHKKYGF